MLFDSRPTNKNIDEKFINFECFPAALQIHQSILNRHANCPLHTDTGNWSTANHLDKRFMTLSIPRAQPFTW